LEKILIVNAALGSNSLYLQGLPWQVEHKELGQESECLQVMETFRAFGGKHLEVQCSELSGPRVAKFEQQGFRNCP